MSSNNELRIYKKGTEWIIDDRDIEGCGTIRVGETDSLEKAIKIANDYQSREEVEYGLSVEV